MSYTLADQANANKYVEQWIKHDTIELLYKKYPHIISHLTYDIRKATHDDFYYPKDLENCETCLPIIVTTKINEKLCNLMTCNPQTNSGPCTQSSKPQRYPVGDDGKKDVACQAACFNLFPKDEKTGQQLQLNLTYHKNQCVVVDNSTKSFMELPFTRNPEPETRVTDLPCGFNRSDHEHPYSDTGIQYHYNKSYCDSFFDEFDEDKKVCYVHWSKKYIGNVILGEYIIKAFQALDRKIKTGSTIPPDMMKFEQVEINSNYLLDNWLKNIDTSFVLPTKKITNLTSGRSTSSEEIIKPDQSYSKNSRVKDSLHKPKIKEMKYEDRLGLEDAAKSSVPRTRRAVVPEVNKIAEFFKGIGKSMAEVEFWKDMGLGFASDKLLDKMKKMFGNLLKRLTESVAEKAIGEVTFKTALKQGFTRATKVIAFKIASKTAIALAKFMVSALTIVGIIFDVFAVVDIILMFADPLKLNNKYPDDYLDNMISGADHRVRQTLGRANSTFTFEMLSQFLLTSEELAVININGIRYDAEYFGALKVNSYGSVIDHGNPVEREVINTNIDDHEFNSLRLYSQEDFINYEMDHMKRIKVVDNIKNINYYCTGALIVFLVLQWFLLVILLVLAICCFTYVQYSVLGSDDITMIASYFDY